MNSTNLRHTSGSFHKEKSSGNRKENCWALSQEKKMQSSTLDIVSCCYHAEGTMTMRQSEVLDEPFRCRYSSSQLFSQIYWNKWHRKRFMICIWYSIISNLLALLASSSLYILTIIENILLIADALAYEKTSAHTGGISVDHKVHKIKLERTLSVPRSPSCCCVVKLRADTSERNTDYDLLLQSIKSQ